MHWWEVKQQKDNISVNVVTLLNFSNKCHNCRNIKQNIRNQLKWDLFILKASGRVVIYIYIYIYIRVRYEYFTLRKRGEAECLFVGAL